MHDLLFLKQVGFMTSKPVYVQEFGREKKNTGEIGIKENTLFTIIDSRLHKEWLSW